MIRPFTFVTLMLACSSGAYLFVVKHRAAGLDDQISGITGQIRSAEQRIRVLQAEWAQENDPNRLAPLADQFTALKPMAPDQLRSLSSLADSLPAPGAEMPHLPLPPPPPWAAPAAPAGNAAGPIASAGSIRPAAALSSGASSPAITETALLAPTLPAPKPIKPVEMRPVHPQIAAHGAVHHLARHATPSHGGFQYAASKVSHVPMMTASAAPGSAGMAPRYASALPYRSPAAVQPYRYQPETPRHLAAGTSQSVFGSLGADLPPPQPVYRSPQ